MTDQIADLLAMLDSDDLAARLTAIQVLGEIGDAAALAALRARMTPVNKELAALIVAVGKLKRRLGRGANVCQP
jgi:HEAT repeat protein